jgi:hypothetical protein
MKDLSAKSGGGSPDRGSTDIRNGVAVGILTAVVVYALVLYSPAIRLGFYGDDFHYLPTPELRSMSDVPQAFEYSLKRAPRVISHGLYFVMGRSLWDLDHTKWHIANLVVYVLIVYLLYALLARILRDRLAALLGAGIYALSGVLFHTVVWITGVGDLIATAMVFGGFLAHAKALDIKRESGRTPPGPEILSILLLALSLFTKETMVPVLLVFILADLFVLRRVSIAGLAALALGIVGAVLTVGKFEALQEYHSYAVSFDPVKFAGNLFAYFYDPLFAVGGQYWVMHRLGLINDPGALGQFLKFAKANLALTVVIVIAAFFLAVIWIRLTLIPWRSEDIPDESRKPLLPPIFGWLAWLIVLSPALLTPAHHYAYYLMIPFGLLMITAAPVIASGLRYRDSRIAVIILIVLYLAWFPVNTSLAFKYSSPTTGAAQSLDFINQMKAMYPTIAPGTMVILDKVDPRFDWAIYHGAAVETYYPGTISLSCFDLDEMIDNCREVPMPPDSPVLVFREEDGRWVDVTAERAGRFREALDYYERTDEGVRWRLPVPDQ